MDKMFLYYKLILVSFKIDNVCVWYFSIVISLYSFNDGKLK